MAVTNFPIKAEPSLRLISGKPAKRSNNIAPVVGRRHFTANGSIGNCIFLAVAALFVAAIFWFKAERYMHSCLGQQPGSGYGLKFINGSGAEH